MDRTDARAVYGVDLVSSFYGPGIWGAWLLVVLSTFLDKIFGVEQENEPGMFYILGADLNLASAFAYPIIAAIDILAHSHRYFNDDVVSERAVASVDAALVVLREGMSLGALLFLTCVVRIRRGFSPRPAVFSDLALIFLLVVNKVFELQYCRFGAWSYVNVVLMMPFGHRKFYPESALASKYSGFGSTFRNEPKDGLFGIPFFDIGVLINPGLQTEVGVKTVCLLPAVIWPYTRRSIRGVLEGILMTDALWLIWQTGLDLVMNTVFILLAGVIGGSPLPISDPTWRSFDQYTAFTVTGLIPLVFSIRKALRENADTFAGWWHTAQGWLGRFIPWERFLPAIWRNNRGNLLCWDFKTPAEGCAGRAREESSSEKDCTWALHQFYLMKWRYTFLTACVFLNCTYLRLKSNIKITIIEHIKQIKHLFIQGDLIL